MFKNLGGFYNLSIFKCIIIPRALPYVFWLIDLLQLMNFTF